MEMKKFEEMRLIATGNPEQDEALLEWLYLTILGRLAMGLPPLLYRG